MDNNMITPMPQESLSSIKKRRGRPPGSTIKNSFVLTSNTLFDTSRHMNTCQEVSDNSNVNKNTRRTRRQRSDDYIRRKFLYEEAVEPDISQSDVSKRRKKQCNVIEDNDLPKPRRGRPPKSQNDNAEYRFLSSDLFTQDEIDRIFRPELFDFCLTSPLKTAPKRTVDFTDLDLLPDLAPVKVKRKSKLTVELPEMTDDIVSEYFNDCNLDELGIASDDLPDFDFPEGQNGLPNVQTLDKIVCAEAPYFYENSDSPDFLIDPPTVHLSSNSTPQFSSSSSAPCKNQTVPQRRRKSPLRPLDSVDYQLPYFSSNKPGSCNLNAFDYPLAVSKQTTTFPSNTSKSLETPLHDLDLSVDFNQIPFQIDSSCVTNFSVDIPIEANDFLPTISSINSTKRTIKHNRRSRKLKEESALLKVAQLPAQLTPAPGKSTKRPAVVPHRPSILRSNFNKPTSVVQSNQYSTHGESSANDSFSTLTESMTKYSKNAEKASDLIFQRLNCGQVQEASQPESYSGVRTVTSNTASSVLLKKKHIMVNRVLTGEVAEASPIASTQPNPIEPPKPTSNKSTSRVTKSVKSIEIKKPNDDLVSGFQRLHSDNDYDDVEYDVYRIPSKSYSNNQCFIDYEPQIKERREKVITQDMIDQRPRQAIRKYYNSLKKHLCKQDRSLNQLPPWTQSAIDSGSAVSQNSGLITQLDQADMKSTITVESSSSQLNSGVDSRSRNSQKHYKVVVVDDPSGYQEAVLVSHPQFHTASSGGGTGQLTSVGSTFLHDSMVTTNTAVRNIKGRSRRSLLKEFRAGVENQLRNSSFRYNQNTVSSSLGPNEDPDEAQFEIQISDSSLVDDE